MRTQNIDSKTHMDSKTYYETNGYVIYPKLVDTELIDRLLNLYKEQIVPSKESFLRQITNEYEPNDFNEFGYVKQDFLDVHKYDKFPDFSTSVKEIVCSDAIQNALKQITGSNSLYWLQSLLFDLNRGTVPHQDSYYVDTVPSGHALAVWIALEDIDERAGRFYVLPQTTHVDLHTNVPNLTHWEWMLRMKDYFDANQDKVFAPALNKGDALFWNARLVHGASPTIDPSFSRKSLAAHFIPSEYKFENLFTTKVYIEDETYKGVKIYSGTVPDSSEWASKKMGE